ncbi:MAG: tRNA 2-thiocytidine biosynthesis protein TtcA [Erysipelotrichaceae bacterium]|nr:tRNA 2-thiocytidine biosynthesis protein TtcA [Erysipelotrichaceae bacterium]
MERYEEIERSIVKRFRKEIWCRFVKAINEYKMIEPGDRIAVCISGGKDSMLLAKCMQEIQRHGKMDFTLKFIVMDPGYNEENRKRIEDNAVLLNIPIQIFHTEIFDYVHTIDDSPCYLCARMRRGYLYRFAKETGCNKIALGHHFDDVIETTLMGMLYGGQFQAMMPKIHSTNFEGMELIRPLYMVKEKDILDWCRYNELEFIRCACRFTENRDSEEFSTKSKRQEMKELIARYRTINPNVDINIFRSIHNVNLNTVIGYHDSNETVTFEQQYERRKR